MTENRDITRGIDINTNITFDMIFANKSEEIKKDIKHDIKDIKYVQNKKEELDYNELKEILDKLTFNNQKRGNKIIKKLNEDEKNRLQQFIN